jgi:hypothetical protein
VRSHAAARARSARDLRPGRSRPHPRALVTGAGFGEPGIEEIVFDFGYADDDDFWDALVRLAGPLAQVINALREDERQATHDAILESVKDYRNEDGPWPAPP